jgi:RNA recognition motif-containing protein
MIQNSNIKLDTNGQQNQGDGMGVSVTNNRANLIVNYLPQSLKEQDFNQLFSKIGPLKACKLMFDRTTGLNFN